MKYPEMLKPEGRFSILINSAIFFDEPIFPIMEFIFAVANWADKRIKTLDMNYNSIETEDNPLISFIHNSNGWHITSKWQKFNATVIFQREEIITSFRLLSKQVKEQFRIIS